jgi:hypothetical protein
VVVGAYQEWQIKLGKVAEWLELTELEFHNCFIEPGIPLCLFLYEESVSCLKDGQYKAQGQDDEGRL